MRAKRLLPFAVSAAVALIPALLAAQEGVSLNGYARTKAGTLLEDGSYFIGENTLDVRLSMNAGDAGFYANPVLYEREGTVEALDLREAYVDFSSEWLDLRLGKQQVIWGKADGVFITDIVSPKDLSRFLVPDFEELRLAVTAVRSQAYVGAHGFEFTWIPWFTPTVAPETGSLWAPAMPFPVQPTFENPDLPERALENGEYFARYSYMGESFDLMLMGGWFWEDTPAFAVTGKTFTPGVGLTGITVTPEYYRNTAAGGAISAAVGPVILRAEGAWYANRRFQGDPAEYELGYAEKSAVQYVIGTDFAVAGYSFGLQFIQDIVLDHEDALLEEAFQNTGTLVVAKSFLAESLTAEVFTYLVPDPMNALVKPKLTWDASDSLELFAGAYLFIGDEGDFGQYNDNDGAYLGAKFSF